MKYAETVETLGKALHEDNSIGTSRDLLFNHPGSTPEYLESLGLTRSRLKRLERLGLAIRARTKNIWLTGETAPTGEVVGTGYSLRGKGSRVRWILITGEGNVGPNVTP